MTSIYFVRHAQPDHDWGDDSTRPLTPEGVSDSAKVYETRKRENMVMTISIILNMAGNH